MYAEQLRSKLRGVPEDAMVWITADAVIVANS